MDYKYNGHGVVRGMKNYGSEDSKDGIDRQHRIEARLDKSDPPGDVVMNPGTVDEIKWAAAKKKSTDEYGDIRWPVVTKIYKTMHGTFHKSNK